MKVSLILVLLLTLNACGHSNSLPFENSFDGAQKQENDVADSDQEQNPNQNGGGSPDVSSGNLVSFVTFGDWGSGREEQRDVAFAIGDYCAVNACDFILTLGDNFYSNGVESVIDALWDTRYHAVYDFLDLPFYVSLGNHDNQGSIQAQVDYSEIDPNWRMPAEEYVFSKPDGASPPVAEFFIINSDYPHFDGPAQTWLDQSLAASQARWKFLAMHHPIYSNGNHGDGDDDYREALVPIICGRIDLVLSGHDHSFAHMRSDEDSCPIEQFVIGTGGANLRGVDENDPRAVASTASVYGFGWFQVTPNKVLFRMIDTNGAVFYETSFRKE